VTVDGRRYVLVLCMLVHRNFRVIVRDEDATTNFSAMAKDITDVSMISGKSLSRIEKERATVLHCVCYVCS
jgi:hypothetical protein